jgi:hypothetical protein
VSIINSSRLTATTLGAETATVCMNEGTLAASECY